MPFTWEDQAAAILNELAQMKPTKRVEHRIMFDEVYEADECVFCHADTMSQHPLKHKSSCLWVRAQRVAVKPTKAEAEHAPVDNELVQIIKDLCGWSEEGQAFFPGTRDEQGGCNFCGGGDWNPDVPYTDYGHTHHPHAHYSDCPYLRAREAIGMPLISLK